MKVKIQRLYNHLCTWSFFYVIFCYTMFSALNYYNSWWKDPYSLVMCAFAAFFILVMWGLQCILYYWEKNDSE